MEKTAPNIVINPRDAEIKRLGLKLSYQTLVKIQIRIKNIFEYMDHLEVLKKNIPERDYKIAYQAYFTAVSTLYRSLFKGLDKGVKINIKCFVESNGNSVLENHHSLINIADKDLAHLDKNSKSHKIMDVEVLKKTGNSVIVSSHIGDDQMKPTTSFLSDILLPAIEEATAIALKK